MRHNTAPLLIVVGVKFSLWGEVGLYTEVEVGFLTFLFNEVMCIVKCSLEGESYIRRVPCEQ